MREESGADKVTPHIGRAAISAVNLQDVVKELLLSGLDEATTREFLGELRLDVRAHDVEATYAAAALHAQTRQYGRGLGDRPCLALAVQLGVSALTADREWKNGKIRNLKVEHIR
ncbi:MULTISPECIES: PIN domain-containing protein [Sphingomonas]|uniref:PIN domain-containing protein n=1 Tax=Sphingomonas kyungheensis TaxID=1069987 RepID=A0ABU8H6U7_9SPHN|nr:PIN domain-containing protein [Sphingomonas sp. CV7422]